MRFSAFGHVWILAVALLSACASARPLKVYVYVRTRLSAASTSGSLEIDRKSVSDTKTK